MKIPNLPIHSKVDLLIQLSANSAEFDDILELYYSLLSDVLFTLKFNPDIIEHRSALIALRFASHIIFK